MKCGITGKKILKIVRLYLLKGVDLKDDQLKSGHYEKRYLVLPRLQRSSVLSCTI